MEGGSFFYSCIQPERNKEREEERFTALFVMSLFLKIFLRFSYSDIPKGSKACPSLSPFSPYTFFEESSFTLILLHSPSFLPSTFHIYHIYISSLLHLYSLYCSLFIHLKHISFEQHPSHLFFSTLSTSLSSPSYSPFHIPTISLSVIYPMRFLEEERRRRRRR